MKKFHLTIILVIGFSFFGAGLKAGPPSWRDQPAVIKMIEEARKNTKQVPLAEFKKLWDEDADIIILDVRTPREYEAAHIPWADNAPRGLLEFAIWSLVQDQNEHIYVYCKTGGRAALATELLNEFGYKNAFAVSTGIADWARSGYPVQTSITDEELILLPAEE
ncbi:MAG: rhodanese-like domain-containing protein [Desulfocapsaceae bacterium]